MWMTSWPETWVEIWEKSVSWVPASEKQSRVLASEEDAWLSELAETLQRVPRVVGGGADGKVVIERLCLSLPHVEKSFNSKIIKSFVPELRSHKVFRVSGFLCYLYVRYEHSMYISRIHVWLCDFSVFLLWSRLKNTVCPTLYQLLNFYVSGDF